MYECYYFTSCAAVHPSVQNTKIQKYNNTKYKNKYTKIQKYKKNAKIQQKNTTTKSVRSMLSF